MMCVALHSWKNEKVLYEVLVFQLVAHWLLVEGVRREMEAVRRGFETIIKIDDLTSFTPDEVALQFIIDILIL